MNAKRIITAAAVLAVIFGGCSDKAPTEAENSYASVKTSGIIAPVLPTPDVPSDPDDEKPTLRSSQVELIALLAVAEAETECEEGKRLVIDTVFNRMDSEDFPDTVVDVIFEPYQYPSMTNGRADECVVTDDIRELVLEEYEHRLNDEVLYFNEGGYFDWGTPMFRVQSHYFSKD